MEQRALRNVNNCLYTNVYFYLETSGGINYNTYLNVVHFSTPELIRHLWQLKTIFFLHQYVICSVPLVLLINHGLIKLQTFQDDAVTFYLFFEISFPISRCFWLCDFCPIVASQKSTLSTHFFALNRPLSLFVEFPSVFL